MDQKPCYRGFYDQTRLQELGFRTFPGGEIDWWKQVWKSEGPIKAKITLWLALRNKLLTWENIKK